MNKKLIELVNWFSDKKSILVSLSGGVDSALVAFAAYKKLGKNATAITADYKTLSKEELDSANVIAKEIGMHESTISRCTNKKYIQTPRGVYEMKYFFSSEIKTKFGAMASSRSVKSLLKDIISKENPESPLSDIQIAESLTKNGFKIARRTISKYRESLSIPPSNERKNIVKWMFHNI